MTLTRTLTRSIAMLAAVLILGGWTTTAVAQKAGSNTSVHDYCTSTGGRVEVRVPYYGTNGAKNTWLRLAGKESFCQYTASDGSRIHVSQETLYTTLPTLAALAYYSQVAWNGQGQGNPASLYCTQLGGSDLFGGINLAGGGWVENGAIDEVLEACIFPDNSTIDSWGLFYHSANIIRGIDLSTVLRYKNPYATRKNNQ